MPNSILRNIKVDWPFLFFVLGITYVKFYVKLAAIVLYFSYVLYRCYKLKKPNAFQWFYLLIISVGIISALANSSFYNAEYSFGFYFGLLQWIVALMASYLIYITIINLEPDPLQNAIKAFFAINIIVSVVTLFMLFVEAGFNVPYWHNEGGKFGVSTGDHINGVFSDNSVTNAAVSALGALYFLYRKQFKWAVLCCLVMLLCTSNVTVIFLGVILVTILATKKDMRIKKYALLLLFMMAISYPILSPQNLKYIEVVYEREQKDDYNIGLDKLADREIAITPEVEQKDFFKKNINSVYKVDEYDKMLKAYRYYPYKEDVLKPLFNPKEFYTNIGRYKMELKQQWLINVAGELSMLQKEATKKEDNAEEMLHVALNPFSVQKAIGNWYKKPADKSELVDYNMPGKIYTNMQTLYFLRSNPRHFFARGWYGQLLI